MERNKRGRKSSVTFIVDKMALSAADGNIKQILKTKIRAFSVSGSYIPLSQDYKEHDAFVIVLDKK